MKILKNTFKWLGLIIFIPMLYFIVALVLTHITVNKNRVIETRDYEIFLSTNGIHSDIILPIKDMDINLLKNTNYNPEDSYFSYGWGNENFYLNTPNWSDLTFKNAVSALFFNDPTLMHVTRYKNKQKNWIKIPVSNIEFENLQYQIDESFKKDLQGNKIIIENQSYQANDSFYKANGAYSCINTCNSWVNNVLKKSGLKAALWTPFDFGVLDKYSD